KKEKRLRGESERRCGSGLQLEAGGGQPVEAAPHQAIDQDYDGGHDQGRGQKQVKAAGIAGAADGAAQPGGFHDFPLKMKIFRDDTGIPRAARRGDHSGDEVGKNSREDEVTPAIETAKSENVGDFFQIRGNGHSAGDDVEEDVPLSAEEHERHGSNFHATAQANQKKKNDRE